MDDHDLMAQAHALLQQAAREPRGVHVSATRLLRAAQAAGAAEATAVAGRAIGLAALYLGRIDAAVGHLEAAVAAAEEAGAEQLAAEARMTLAFAFGRRGDAPRALRTIDQAIAGSSGVAHARALAQRAPILQDFERFDDAEADYRLALPTLRKAGDWTWIIRVYSNRAQLRISRGQFAAAEMDLEQAERLATAHGLDLQRAFNIESLAFLHVRREVTYPRRWRAWTRPSAGTLRWGRRRRPCCWTGASCSCRWAFCPRLGRRPRRRSPS